MSVPSAGGRRGGFWGLSFDEPKEENRELKETKSEQNCKNFIIIPLFSLFSSANIKNHTSYVRKQSANNE